MEDYYKIQKRASTELFLPENDFKTSSLINFPKKVQILEIRKQTKGMNLRLYFHMPLYIWTQYNIKIGLGS